MAVITLSRTFGSGGDEIAFELCRRLGYQLFDKKLVEAAAREAGFTGSEIPDLCEDTYKVRNLIERLFERALIVPYMGISPEDLAAMYSVEAKATREEDSLRFVQTAIQVAYQRGNMVILGRGGQVILKDYPGVLHVRVDAPPADRIERVLQTITQIRPEVGNQPPARSETLARECIQERDAASADYIRRFYHANWADPLLYHLVINTGKCTIEQAAVTIARIARRLPTPAQPLGEKPENRRLDSHKIERDKPMESCIGQVTHYYNHLGVAVLSLTGPLAVNDILHLYGHSTDFYQKAWSLEINHAPVASAGPGMEVALKVVEPVREGDRIFLVMEAAPGEREAILQEQLREWEEEG